MIRTVSHTTNTNPYYIYNPALCKPPDLCNQYQVRRLNDCIIDNNKKYYYYIVFDKKLWINNLESQDFLKKKFNCILRGHYLHFAYFSSIVKAHHFIKIINWIRNN